MSQVCRTVRWLGLAALLYAGCGRSNLSVPREQVGAGLRDAGVGEGSAPQAGSIAPPPPGGPPPVPGIDGGVRDGGAHDGGFVIDAGRPRDAGIDAAIDSGVIDAGEVGPPIIELLAPGHEVEVYQGDRVAFLASCKAVGNATVAQTSWLFDVGDDVSTEAFGDSADQVFATTGTFDIPYSCRDSRGLSSSEHVTVHVQSPAPFLVYRDPDHLQAARVDRLDQPVMIEPALPPDPPLIDEDFQYARGGKAVIVTASSERHGYRTYAIYLDAPAGMQLHELDDHGDQELRTTPNALVSPDGRYVFVPHVHRQPRLYRLDTPAPTEMTAVAVPASATNDQSGTQFSSDSRYLLYSAGGDLDLVDLQNGAALALWSNALAASGSSLRFAKLTGDGTHVVYAIAGSDGLTTTYLISAVDAFAGEPAIQLGARQASPGFWQGGSGAVLVFGYAPNSGIGTITAYDRTGSAIASYDGSESVATCGDSLLLYKSDGSLAVVHPGATTESLLGLDRPTGRASFSSDCHALAYQSGADVLFLALPAPGSPPSTPAADRIVQQRLGSIVTAQNGVAVAVTSDPAVPASPPDFLQLNRLGQPAALLWRSDFALTPDGTGVLSFRSSNPGFPRESALDLGTFPTNSTPLAGTQVYGPIQVSPNQHVVISPDGKHALIHPQQSVDENGVPVGLRGLVEVDLADPNGPGTRALLPDGEPARAGFAVQRIPSQRAVMITASGDVPNTTRFFARSLVDGATTIEQDRDGPPNSFGLDLAIGTMGSVFALHDVLHDYDEMVVARIRTQPDDPHFLRSVASDVDERLVGFGAGSGQLVLTHGGLDLRAGADVIERYDIARDRRRVVAQSSGDQGLELERLIPGFGRMFFQRYDRASGSSVLFVEDGNSVMPTALTPSARVLEAVNIAPEGDRLSVQLTTSSSQPDVWVLDEQSAWANVPVPTIYSATAMVTFFSNASRQGEIMSVPGQAGVLRIASRGSLGDWREVNTHAFSWQKSADDTHAVLIASDIDGGGRVFTVDLRSEKPEVQDRGGIATYMATPLALSPDGRFLALDFDNHDKVLFDIVSGVATHLPMTARDLAFDRLGRYLAYDNDGTTCDIHVLALDQLDDGPRVIARACPGDAPLWVD